MTPVYFDGLMVHQLAEYYVPVDNPLHARLRQIGDAWTNLREELDVMGLVDVRNQWFHVVQALAVCNFCGATPTNFRNHLSEYHKAEITGEDISGSDILYLADQVKLHGWMMSARAHHMLIDWVAFYQMRSDVVAGLPYRVLHNLFVKDNKCALCDRQVKKLRSHILTAHLSEIDLEAA